MCKSICILLHSLFVMTTGIVLVRMSKFKAFIKKLKTNKANKSFVLIFISDVLSNTKSFQLKVQCLLANSEQVPKGKGRLLPKESNKMLEINKTIDITFAKTTCIGGINFNSSTYFNLIGQKFLYFKRT